MQADAEEEGGKAVAEADGAAAKPNGVTVPDVAWTAGRIDADLKLAQELAAKLDEEKGIQDNSLLAGPPQALPPPPPKPEGAAPAADGAAQEAKAAGESDAAPAAETTANGKEEGEGVSYEEQVCRPASSAVLLPLTGC